MANLYLKTIFYLTLKSIFIRNQLQFPLLTTTKLVLICINVWKRLDDCIEFRKNQNYCFHVNFFKEIDQELADHSTDATYDGDESLVVDMLHAGMPVDIVGEHIITKFMRAVDRSVIQVKEAQGFLDGFGIFWKKKKFFFPVYLLKMFMLICFSKCNFYIFSQYWYV